MVCVDPLDALEDRFKTRELFEESLVALGRDNLRCLALHFKPPGGPIIAVRARV